MKQKPWQRNRRLVRRDLVEKTPWLARQLQETRIMTYRYPEQVKHTRIDQPETVMGFYSYELDTVFINDTHPMHAADKDERELTVVHELTHRALRNVAGIVGRDVDERMARATELEHWTGQRVYCLRRHSLLD